MEDQYHYPYLFTSETLLGGSIFNDQINDFVQFDPIIENFDQTLCDYMLSGARYLDNVFDSGIIGLPVDAVVASSDPSLCNNNSGDHFVFAEMMDHEQNSGEGNSSGKMMKPRRDRSKTLVSERKRRGRMKENLYELRSLVPNITKMDKASIVADAIVYVQGLQNKAKKLVEEVSFLESSLKEDHQVVIQNAESRQVEAYNSNRSSSGKVMEVVAHELAEGTFYVKVQSSTGDGVTSSLYSAIESLENFEIESTNLSFVSDRFVLVVTLKVRGPGEAKSASAIKLWVMGALLREGFLFDMSLIQ